MNPTKEVRTYSHVIQSEGTFTLSPALLALGCVSCLDRWTLPRGAHGGPCGPT